MRHQRNADDHSGGACETTPEGEGLFRRAFERLPDPTLLWRRLPEGEIVLERANAAAYQMSRGGIEELLGVEVEAFFTHAPQAAANVRRAFETEEPLRLERPYRLRTTGEDKWLRADYVRVSADYVLNTIHDITARKQAEEAFHKEEREKSIVLDAMTEMLAYHNTDLEIQWANRASGDSVGERPEDLVGRHCYAVWHQRDAPCEVCPVLRALETGARQEAEVVTPDGRIWFLRGVPVFEGGEIVGVVEFGQEITARKRVEERLRLFEAIIEASREAIAISDPAGHLVYVNPAHERLFGRSLEEAREVNYRDYYPPESVAVLEREVVPALARGEGWEGELDALDADGRRFTLWERADSLHDAQGDMRYGFGLMHDVTERRRAEEAYRAVVHHSLQGLCILQAGRVVFANEALAEMFGYTVDELLALCPDQIEKAFTPEGRAFIRRQREKRQAGERHETRYEIRVRDKDGYWLWTEHFVAPIEYQGQPALQIAVIDVTERKRAERTLRESEERFRTLAELAPIGIYLTDLHGNCQYANELWLEMAGLSLEEALGKGWAQGIHPADRQSIAEAWREMVASEGRWGCEYRFQDSEGNVTWVYGVAAPQLDDEGEIIGYIGANLDVTERKWMEDALRESEERLSLIVHSVPVAFFTADERKTTWVSEQFEKLTGIPPQKFVQDPDLWLARMHPDDRDRVLEESKQFYEMDQVSVEFRWRCGDGTYRWFLDRARQFCDQAGNKEAIGLWMDITALKRTEDALRQHAAQLETLRQLALELTAELDLDQLLRSIISQAVDLIGGIGGGLGTYRPALDAVKFSIHVGFDRLPEIMAIRRGEGLAGQLWETGASFIVDDYQDWEGNIDAWAEVLGHVPIVGVPVRWGGDILGVLQVVGDHESHFGQPDADLLTLFAAQAAIAIRNARLYDRAQREIAERKQAEQRLAHSNAELEQYAYVISHDLREPLRVTGSYIQLLEQRYADQLEGDAQEYIDYALDAVRRMKGMTQGLLDLSRVERRGGPLAPTDCEELLAYILSVLSLAIEESGAQVTHDPLPTVLADEAQLAQVFQNLLENAIKFRREGCEPRIHVSAACEGDECTFAVRDNGVGLDPTQSERVFQVFQRLHTRDEYPGQGIGLALCKKILERHGGRIWVESAPGQGATFYFTLPRAAA